MKLAPPPVLRPLDQSKPVVIDTDSSKAATGGVLLQPNYRRYSSQEREMLAVVQALQTWRHWLEGLEVFIRTDHQSLASIRTPKNLPSHIQRLGKENVLADWLSRSPETSIMATTNISPSDSNNSSEKLPNLNNLSWIDLQAIIEHLVGINVNQGGNILSVQPDS
ncbi:hypothetical protein K3495_g12417 [Podosphaera aphanis]|nr:hypothetical protein K3495_g12417 [Podosphaera aphanis]